MIRRRAARAAGPGGDEAAPGATAKGRSRARARSHATRQADRVDPEMLSPRTVLLAVGGFIAFFALIIAAKVNDERLAAITEAEVSQARTAAFLAERVSARLAEVRGALALAAAEVSASSGADRENVRADALRSRLDAMTRSPYIDAAAFLPPDGDIIASERFTTSARAAADAALAEPSGVAAITGGAEPWIATVEPVRLAPDRVGVLIARTAPQTLLPAWRDDQVSILADAEGRALALHPPAPVSGAPFAAARVGVDPERAAAIARDGGALSGASVDRAEHILGLAALADAPLQTYTLGPAALDGAAWRRTVLFYLLLGIGPLIVAVVLAALLLAHMSKLNATKARLAASEHRLRLAIEGARCGVWDWDLDADDVYMTGSLSRMVGGSQEELLTGANFLALLSQDDRARLRAALRGAAGGEEVDVEVRALRLPVWLHMRGRPLPPEAGSTRRIVGVAIDITERKGAQARVAAAETRLRAALESMTESFVLWDSRRRLVLWNRKFREFFGFADGQLKTGMAYEAVEAGAGRAIKDVHANEDGESAGAYELELADGRWLHYSERRTAEGGLVSVGADISALKAQESVLVRSESELRQTVEDLERSRAQIQELASKYEEEKIRAEEANRSKSEFLANMSHELRTPLNAINGFSEMMLKEMFGPLGDDRYHGYIQDIHESGQHLLALINDILDMSKIEAGKMVLQSEPVRPGELIEQCIRLMRARAEEKDIVLKVEGEDLPEIAADPRAVKQVVLNLLSNAVKFTPEGGRVVVRGFHAADGIVLQVADTGIGIPEDALPRLGVAFEQIESHHAKSHQGSGLGLALSKSLVEMHGGSLRIDSVLGKGTTVSFTLPAEPGAAKSGDPAQDAA